MRLSFRRGADIGHQLLQQQILTATTAQFERWQRAADAVWMLYDDCVINAEQARAMRERLRGLIEKGVKKV